MRIAILGWGSLLWDEKENKTFRRSHKAWQLDGPTLKLEFSRRSKSRGGALTLVIDNKHGHPCTVSWCISTRGKLCDAVCDLRCREGTTLGNIGQLEVQDAEPDDTTAKHAIWAWAQLKRDRLDAVAWTNLHGDFDGVTPGEFLGEAVAYLKGLKAADKAVAAEYIWRAPEFVETPLRTAMQNGSWFALAMPGRRR